VFGSTNRSSRFAFTGKSASATGGDLNTKEKINASSNASNATHSFFSAGESFADGVMIELVSAASGLNKPDLLLWDGRKATVGPRVEHGGCIYEAPELAPSLYRALRLPYHCRDYGSARDLLAETADLFRHHSGSLERKASLLACFSTSTWLADRLPIAPSLLISGADEELGIDVLRLLSCVCRHPLMLAELTPSGFRSLPMQLSPTLLLNQRELKPTMERLLRASSYRDLYLAGNGGSVVNPYGPKVILCGDDAAVDALGAGVIHVAVAPSQMQSAALDEQLQSEIANRFQPRFLMYRLRNATKVRESEVDASNLTLATRRLARTLAACFPEDSELARDIVQLLQPQDEEIRGQHSRDINCAIVTILWGFLHEQKEREVRVDELAKDVNKFLRDRGEIREYSAEELGWKLRDLNIPRHNSSSGRHVLLERDTSQSVHRLAQVYDLPCSQPAQTGCPDCSQLKATLSK
jgi:hypothetical protein